MPENAPQLSRSLAQQLTDRLADTLTCLRFCTRLPIPPFAFEKQTPVPSLARAGAMLPIAGGLVGCLAAVVLCLCAAIGLPVRLAALFAIAALVVATGALHEDGLADCADSLGGATREQRLAIMKDSRIGTYGSLALVLVTIARLMSLAHLAHHGLGLASTVLIAAAAASRGFALAPLHYLLPAKSDGLGAVFAMRRADLITAAILAFILSLLPLVAHAGFGRVIAALILGGAVTCGVIALARRMIAGQTGDVAGATQQVAELAFYLAFAARL